MPYPSSHKLRSGRYSEQGRIYFITICCYRRRTVFASFSTGRLVIQALQSVQDRAETLSFVVMPDHIHWLIQLQEGAKLSPSVQKMKSIASRLIHQNTAYKAQVWDSSFHDHAIRKYQDVKGFARYIILNPLRAGLVNRIGDYPLWDAIWL